MFLRKNFAKGLLANSINSAANSIVVQAGHSLPTESGSFRVVIWNRKIHPNPADDPSVEIVTASFTGTPNVYSIIRAQEGTTAVTHNVGAVVGLHYTAGVSEDDMNYVGGSNVITPFPVMGDVLKWNGVKWEPAAYLKIDSDLKCFVLIL